MRNPPRDVEDTILVAADVAEENGQKLKARVLRYIAGAADDEILLSLRADPAFGGNVIVDWDHAYAVGGREHGEEDWSYVFYFDVMLGIDGKWYYAHSIDIPNDTFDWPTEGPFPDKLTALTRAYWAAVEELNEQGAIDVVLYVEPATMQDFIREQAPELLAEFQESERQVQEISDLLFGQ